jgi:hypothetical protein
LYRSSALGVCVWLPRKQPAFVKKQARRMLHGDISAVIHSLQWQGTHHKLKGKAHKTLAGICGYLRVFSQQRPSHGL